MAQLLVRKVDERIVRALKERAVAHGVSAEEEHRRILLDSLCLKDHDLELNRSFVEHLLAIPEMDEEGARLFDRNDLRNKPVSQRPLIQFDDP